ncbi:MAG: C-GCAxxG-C-C family protein [Eubacteriales bacterium]|nr:C-GCAxxG-C-C family protein [Eubacteriales bacterium]MDY3332614.1 C-GCAxxG-C-C family protein [Gallibacter sp.]
MNTDFDINEIIEDGRETFNTGFACSETIVDVFRRHAGVEMSEDAIAMSSGFPGGVGMSGCICGALAGATMCIGYLYGRTKKNDVAANKCIKVTRELHDKFVERNGATCCRALIKQFESMNNKPRKEHCTKMVEGTLEDLFNIIKKEEVSI